MFYDLDVLQSDIDKVESDIKMIQRREGRFAGLGPADLRDYEVAKIMYLAHLRDMKVMLLTEPVPGKHFS